MCTLVSTPAVAPCRLSAILCRCGGLLTPTLPPRRCPCSHSLIASGQKVDSYVSVVRVPPSRPLLSPFCYLVLASRSVSVILLHFVGGLSHAGPQQSSARHGGFRLGSFSFVYMLVRVLMQCVDPLLLCAPLAAHRLFIFSVRVVVGPSRGDPRVGLTVICTWARGLVGGCTYSVFILSGGPPGPHLDARVALKLSRVFTQFRPWLSVAALELGFGFGMWSACAGAGCMGGVLVCS